MEAHGIFEDILYRAFSKKEYAFQFLDGEIRFGHIYNIKTLKMNSYRISLKVKLI